MKFDSIGVLELTKVLMSLPGQWVDQVRVRQPATKLILDMDSSDSPIYAHQEGSAYSGHFGYTLV